MLKNDVLNLLKTWCDNFMEYQISHKDKFLDGSAICPACGVVHGRTADSVFPLMLLYKETGEEKYLNSAKQFIDWAEENVIVKNVGLYRNDLDCYWLGISTFFGISLGKTLLYFSDLLESETLEYWKSIYKRITEALSVYFQTVTPNINYIAGNSLCMAIAYKILGEEMFKTEGARCEAVCRNLFDEDGIFMGEGHPWDYVSPKGCRHIDIGYNLEETLPSLIEYAIFVDDEDLIKFYADRTLDHLNFLLPDGAIDNSFGTRNAKWTYWGSRTSDGLVGTLTHLTHINPIFAKAVKTNFELYKRCSQNGLLNQGLMSFSAGEPTCLHHTFAHIKSLADMYIHINEKDFENLQSVKLPREENYGVKLYQSGNVALVSFGGFKATISATDVVSNIGACRNECYGGSLTLLWNEKFGAICASTTHNFVLQEPRNMQYSRFTQREECMTPRVVWNEFGSDTCKTATLAVSENEGAYTVIAEGEENFSYKIAYTFSKDEISITVLCEKDAEYSLPIIADFEDKVVLQENSIIFKDMLSVTGENILPIKDVKFRSFHPVGGFLYLPLKFKLSAGKETVIKLKMI